MCFDFLQQVINVDILDQMRQIIALGDPRVDAHLSAHEAIYFHTRLSAVVHRSNVVQRTSPYAFGAKLAHKCWNVYAIRGLAYVNHDCVEWCPM